MMFVCIARCYVFLSFTCLTRDSVGKILASNGESNFNNFVATNDERRFFTRHRYPVSFFIEKNCLCLLGKRDDDELFTKKFIQQSTPTHIKHEVKTTSKCTKFISNERAYDTLSLKFTSILLSFNVSKTFFFTASYLCKNTLYSSRSQVASTLPPISESIVFG